MQQAIWDLPQAGILSNKQLYRKLAPFGYYKCVNTSGLWFHMTHPITFTLVLDNFGVKYADKADVDHLIASIKDIHAYQGLNVQSILKHKPGLGLPKIEPLIS